jgi:Kef-type K+ transport system membrane component KefB
MRNALLTAGLIGFMFLAKTFYTNLLDVEPPPSVVLGFILLASFSFAKVLAWARLPLITGYIVLGLLAGPSVAGLIPDASVGSLKLIDDIAIVIIAMTAGGEMRWSVLRTQFKAYATTLGVMIAVIASGTFIAVVIYHGFISHDLGRSWPAVFAAAAVLCVSAAAKSPATTIAVLRETEARGPLSEWSLDVVILLDGVVIVLFTFALAFAQAVAGSEGGFQLSEVADLLKHIFGAAAAGLILGAVTTLYLRHAKANHLLFVLILAISAVQLEEIFKFDLLIMGVAIGFSVENFSKQGDRLIDALEHGGAPVYVVFFTLVGARIQIQFPMSYWLVTGLSAAGIAALTYAGAKIGTRIVKAPESVQRYGWLGFVSQAGVNLSFAVVVGERLAGIGPIVESMIIALVAINQIVGPVLFRLGLALAGEIPDPNQSKSGN